MPNLVDQLLNKSKESFFLAIEVYNKPTIRYRVEGFSMFICNAWELLLKARMIAKHGEYSVYYKDNPTRTISLENCIQKVFTNKKAPLRLNLEKIIELRNTSTHFITEEYEMVYVPLFQSCIFNYTEKIKDFFNVDMSDYVPQNFLTLSVSMKPLDANEVRAKYPIELADRLLATNRMIAELSGNNNHAFAVRIEHHHFITKDPSKATSTIRIDKNAEGSATIIKQVQDPSETHKFKAQHCIKLINNRLASDSIPIEINNYHFNQFVKYYGVKENPKMCYCYSVSKNPLYSYSMLAIDLIVEEIEKDPQNILRVIKEQLTKKGKSTPGAKDSKL